MQSFSESHIAHLQKRADRTIRELVTTYGFDPTRSKQAVDAIGDKSDIQMAYNWLLDHGEEDRGGAVNLKHCPHTDSLRKENLISVNSLVYGRPCSQGCSSGETWVCLFCGDTRCSRYVNRHSFMHWDKTRAQEEASITIADAQAGRQAHGHHLALSLSDLSVWCYACEAYIDPSSGKSPILFPLVQRMEALKFGGSSAATTLAPTVDGHHESASTEPAPLSPTEAHGTLGAVHENWALPELVVKCDMQSRPGYRSHAAHEYLDDRGVLREKVEMLAGLMAQSNHAVLYTGAGISTAAGISDYATRAGNASWAACEEKQKPVSLWEAQPTLAHRVFSSLYHHGYIKHWVQQNHDGLPQKAGFPQKDLNEIHGSWYDPSNPVVPMDGCLREDLIHRLLETESSCDLCLALGTSMVGMNADRIAISTSQRARNARATGLVIVSLQRTQYDEIAQLRIFATIDEVASMLGDFLSLGESTVKSSKKARSSVPEHTFSIGSKVRILRQPQWDMDRIGSVGTVEEIDKEGNIRIRMATGSLRVVGKWWFAPENLNLLPIEAIED